MSDGAGHTALCLLSADGSDRSPQPRGVRHGDESPGPETEIALWHIR